MPQSEWGEIRNPWTPSLESFMEEWGLLPGVFLFTPQVCLASPPDTMVLHHGVRGTHEW